MATAVTAWKTGLYRCSGIGQTMYVTAGEELPAHTTCKGDCKWQYEDKDNPRVPTKKTTK